MKSPGFYRLDFQPGDSTSLLHTETLDCTQTYPLSQGRLDTETRVLLVNAEGVFSALDAVADLQAGRSDDSGILRYKTAAGEAMARMDHGFTLALSAIRSIADHTNSMLLMEFERQREVTSNLASLAALVPIIICGSLYVSWRHRRKLEDKFTKRLHFTQFSVDRVADSIFWTTPDGRIILVNDAACRSLGYTRDELLTMSICNIDVGMSDQAWGNSGVNYASVSRLLARRATVVAMDM